jgi:tetratricopeptide (TPR) repeat protein
LIESEIKLFPDQSALREALAAVLYLQAEYVAARKAIEAALQLGAPMWRSSYHLGLIEEALGNTDEAARFYMRSVELKPDWDLARSRLAGVRSVSNPPVRP